jgi:hypothetical protein
MKRSSRQNQCNAVPTRNWAGLNLLRSFLVRVFAALLLAVSIITVSQAASPTRADAATVQCGWRPRCTMYLNRAESYNFAYGSYTPSAPGPIVGVIIILRQSLGFLARYYVNRGQCLRFQVSALPWDAQSLIPYSC